MPTSKRVKAAFVLYRRVAETFQPFCPSALPVIASQADGPSALEAFNGHYSRGEMPPCCSQVALLRDVLRGQAVLGWHIKAWAEGVREGLFSLDEIRRDFAWLPNRVWKAVTQQAERTGRTEQGDER